jgi:putative oxidoreductase
MDRYRDLGLLILRLGIGIIMLTLHGWGKITGGPELWAKLGGGMQNLGIRFLPVFWGLLAALSESLGSVLLVLGLFFRPAAAALAFTMFVAALFHLNLPAGAPNAGWDGASHALELMTVYVALALLGPGKYSLAPRWKRG